jgi:hypothetical protein
MGCNLVYMGCNTVYMGCNTVYMGCNIVYMGYNTVYMGCNTVYMGCNTVLLLLLQLSILYGVKWDRHDQKLFLHKEVHGGGQVSAKAT